ncbi:uncharacterized protein [Clytia hemisphaerica]|uniref:Protein kinase domain-containing protein n=1 Tax=Clytia hemisphaerica TaxID=252671 RepID=A0A7M5UM15_9CNID
MNVSHNTMETPLNYWDTLQLLKNHFPERYQLLIARLQPYQNDNVEAESDSYEEARRDYNPKSLKRKPSSYRQATKQPTESDSYSCYEIDEKKIKQNYQTVVVESNGSNDTTAYAIPSENNYQEAEGLVLGQESSNKVPQETSYPPSPDIIITNENYDDKFQQLTVESPHTEKVNFCIDHHNHKKLTDTEFANLSHIYHAYHCPKLDNYNCSLVQCKDPREFIKAVDYNISQKFVSGEEGNAPRENINNTYKLLVWHAQNCTNRDQCKMPLCKDWDESLNEVFKQPCDESKKHYMVIHSNIPVYAVKDLLNGNSLKTLISVHIDKGTFGSVSHCLVQEASGRQFSTAVKRMGIQDQNVSRILATSVPILKKFSNSPHILVPDLITTSSQEVLMFMPKADISLMDYLKSYQDGMPADAVAYYFFQIAKGVKSFHAQDHVHGDIKISNCLLFDNGKTVKICDLDSVKEESVKQASGSRYYVDPEVLKSRHVRKPADVYSLCQCLPVLLFGGDEVLTKHPNDLYNMIKAKDVDLAEVYSLGILKPTNDRITASIIVSWFRDNVTLCTRRKNFIPKELHTGMLPNQKNVCKHALQGYFSSVLDDFPKGFQMEF